MKRRMFALLLSILMIFSLCGCTQKYIKSEKLSDKVEKTTENQGDILLDDGYNAEAANAAATDFAVRLFQKTAEVESDNSEKNILISPISIYIALAMTENGAKGETLAQMEETLGLNAGQLNSFVSEYLSGLSQGEDYKLNMANSIWFASNERFTVNDGFLQTNADYYEADIFKSDFNDVDTLKDINTWVADETDGMITDILDQIPADAVMYLINALAFESEWEDTYDSAQIKDETFTMGDGTEQKVKMMHSEESFYLEDENATGFIKYYAGQQYAFAALLPNEGITVENYIAGMSGEELQNLLSNPTEVHVNAWMPQFETSYDVEMKEVLKKMGMTDVFNKELADLSGLGTSSAGNIWVNRVIHKTYIEVGALGTKAGAATALEAVEEASAFYSDSKDVRLDRPFVYMIIDCKNNQPIFMGTMMSAE